MDPELPAKLEQFDGKVICLDILGTGLKLYLSTQGTRAGIVLVPGVVPAGKDDRRLVALAQTLARLQFAVLVPDLRGLRRYQVRAQDVGEVADAFRYLASREDLVPEGRAGIAGFHDHGNRVRGDALDVLLLELVGPRHAVLEPLCVLGEVFDRLGLLLVQKAHDGLPRALLAAGIHVDLDEPVDRIDGVLRVLHPRDVELAPILDRAGLVVLDQVLERDRGLLGRDGDRTVTLQELSAHPVLIGPPGSLMRDLVDDIAETKEVIERHEGNLARFQDDEQQIIARFDGDIDRFKTLKGLN